MKFDPSFKLSAYPDDITTHFRREAAIMLDELQANRLEVHLKKPVRYAISHNPSWYSEFATEKCAGYPANNRRRKRTDKNKTGGRIRQRTLKALSRIIENTDRKLTGSNYSFHYDLRLIIFNRLCEGYYATFEGYPNHPESATPGVLEVRDFFKIKTPMGITPMIAELVDDRVPF